LAEAATKQLPHSASLHPTRLLNRGHFTITTTDMSGDLLNLLLQFQPESPEVKEKREYDQAARNFVSQVSNISPSHWQKGADTAQDVLTVSPRYKAAASFS
jgi:hypothetical protein